MFKIDSEVCKPFVKYRDFYGCDYEPPVPTTPPVQPVTMTTNLPLVMLMRERIRVKKEQEAMENEKKKLEQLALQKQRMLEIVMVIPEKKEKMEISETIEKKIFNDSECEEQRGKVQEVVLEVPLVVTPNQEIQNIGQGELHPLKVEFPLKGGSRQKYVKKKPLEPKQQIEPLYKNKRYNKKPKPKGNSLGGLFATMESLVKTLGLGQPVVEVIQDGANFGCTITIPNGDGEEFVEVDPDYETASQAKKECLKQVILNLKEDLNNVKNKKGKDKESKKNNDKEVLWKPIALDFRDKQKEKEIKNLMEEKNFLNCLFVYENSGTSFSVTLQTDSISLNGEGDTVTAALNSLMGSVYFLVSRQQSEKEKELFDLCVAKGLPDPVFFEYDLSGGKNKSFVVNVQIGNLSETSDTCSTKKEAKDLCIDSAIERIAEEKEVDKIILTNVQVEEIKSELGSEEFEEDPERFLENDEIRELSGDDFQQEEIMKYLMENEIK